jgi:GR25 family glycosyltransferase involved in LPS biosynthesis
VDAIDGKLIDEKSLKEHYNELKSKKLCKKLSREEIGCALSHIKVQKLILERDEEFHSLILEDDVIVTTEFEKIKDFEIKYTDGNYIIMFNGTSSNIILPENSKFNYDLINVSVSDRNLTTCLYLKSTNYKSIDQINFYEIEEWSYKVNFKIGAFAYSPSKDSCVNYVKINYPVILPADFIWNYFHVFKLYCPKSNIFEVCGYDQSIIENGRDDFDEKIYSHRFTSRVKSSKFIL